MVLARKPCVEHGDWPATKVQSHEDTRGNVISLLLVAEYSIIMHPMKEENVIQIIDTADTLLLRKSAELVFVYEDFFVLSMTYQSARSALA